MPVFTTALEETGSAEIGIGVEPAIQTGGGASNLVIRRKFKVDSQTYANYLYQLLNPPGGYIQDKKYNIGAGLTPAYLVKQRVLTLDKVNSILECTFAMVPTVYDEYNSETEGFPGVSLSSLYEPSEFLFRDSPITLRTQVRINHTYFLGNPTGIPTYPTFNPLTNQGTRTNTITDDTTPSADEYISMVNGRQEIVIDSAVIPWMGDIWECRTTFALAQ